MDLVRTILLEIEDQETLGRPVEIKAPGYSPDQITYHLKLLSQAGLIEAVNATDMDREAWIPTSLTWHGHEFLEAVRNDGVWQKLKAELKDRGLSVPFQLIEALAIKIVSKYIGLS